MRKVSETVVKAFLAGESKTVANTSTDGKSLFLHGCTLAIKDYYRKGCAIRIYDGGYKSATTKERLNALLQLMNQSGKYETIADCIYQKNFEWFIQFNNNSDGKFINGTIVGVLK